MTVQYKGYEIKAEREKCNGGWDLLYYSIFRMGDGFECVFSFEDSAETIEDKIEQLKGRIDAEHETNDPWMEKENDLLFYPPQPKE